AAQATTQAMGMVTPAEKNTTIPPVSSTEQTRTCVSTDMTMASTNTTLNHTTPNTQMTTAATTTTATTTQTVKSTTGSGNQTTASKSPTTTAMTNTTTVRPGTQTAVPSTTTAARPTPAPQPSAIPTGTYTVSSGNGTCIKAVMGLQLMTQNPEEKRMEYLAVNPNATQTWGSCGTAQAEMNITFSGGFINFTFVK
ncbi:LAMP3 protein, partial [Arenaria interpres]|nr:LAMP3 protein [Arenaria interpres]